MRKSIYFLCLVIFVCLEAHAQVFEDAEFDRAAKQGIEYIYNFEFDKAEQTFLPLKEKYPKHPAPYFCLATNRWWQNYISSKTPLYYGYVEDMIEKALDLNEDFEDKEGYEMEYTYFQFMCNALKARVNSAQGNWWTAANAARKILSPIKKGFQYTDQRAEFAFASGIYHYYAATYPKEYPIVRPFMAFFPEANEALGLREMKQAAAVPNYAQVECLFYLSYIHLEEREEMQEGLDVSRKLAKRFPNNTWFQADYGHALCLNKKYEEARSILQNMVNRYERQSSHDTKNIHSKQSLYTSHLMIKVYQYLGKVYLFHDMNFDEAMKLFEKSEKMAELASVEEDNLLAENMYLKGRCYDGLGNREKAIEHYEEALDMEGNIYIRDDAEACIDTACK